MSVSIADRDNYWLVPVHSGLCSSSTMLLPGFHETKPIIQLRGSCIACVEVISATRCFEVTVVICSRGREVREKACA